MSEIKAMPIKMDGIYGVLEAVEDAVTDHEKYFVLSEKDLDRLNETEKWRQLQAQLLSVQESALLKQGSALTSE